MSVINNKTKENTNVVIKMYHTNQSIHLQGGKIMDMVTSTSLLAECLERHWKNNITNTIKGINEANDALKSMVLKSGMVLSDRTSSGDNILYCEKFDYTSPMKHKLNMHIMSKHGNKIKPLKKLPLKENHHQTRAQRARDHRRGK